MADKRSEETAGADKPRHKELTLGWQLLILNSIIIGALVLGIGGYLLYSNHEMRANEDRVADYLVKHYEGT